MSASALRSVVLVGGSVASVSAADTLRCEGYDGAITVVGDEPHTAYARPPLSKGGMLGQGEDGAGISGGARLPELDDSIEVRTSTRATALDVAGRTVTVQTDGRTEVLPFDGVVLATGARARRLARPGQRGEFVVRDLEDTTALAAALRSVRTVAVLGAGFLGMELASTVRAAGKEVTVVDVLPPLLRQLGPDLSAVLASAATDAGVVCRLSEGGAGLHGDPVDGLRLADGEVVHADLVISAVGDLPNVEWLESSGLPYDGPLVVGADRLVAPGVVAAGDMTATVHPLTGRIQRTPHWHSAISQGRAAAKTLLGLPVPVSRETSYFWTEGFGLDVKIVGEIPPGVDPQVLEGSLESRSALLQWCDDSGPVAAATLNHRMPLVKLKRLAAPALPTAEVSS